MPSVAAEPKTPYQRLSELPENIVGQIINGQLYTQPRPAGPHALVCASLEIDSRRSTSPSPSRPADYPVKNRERSERSSTRSPPVSAFPLWNR